MKRIVFSTIMCAIALGSAAQSGTNSPYSQFGYGKLSDQSQSFNRGMNGVGLALREGNQVNILNPASYSALDSLTFIFDIGMTLQSTHFSEGGKSKNANNADFEYAIGAFRLLKNIGMSFGFLPYSNVGYNYFSTNTVENHTTLPSTNTNVTQTKTYNGEGGLRQIFIGAGWQTPVKGLSIGANFSYLWGDVSNYITNSFSDNSIKSLAKQYTLSASSYKLDLGLQYTHVLDKNNIATIGITYSPGHDINASPQCLIIASSSSSLSNDSTILNATDGCSVPTQIGIGLSLNHKNRWNIAADYTLQKWGSTKFPTLNDAQNAYVTTTDNFSDRHKINLGAEYCRNKNGIKRSDRIRYRFGAGYSTPYLKVAGNEGPKEFSVSAGVGLPIINSWNNRSLLNIGIQWQNVSGSNMLKENTLYFNIGMTFNEKWFDKWKFE